MDRIAPHENADGTAHAFVPLIDRSIVITGATASGKSSMAVELAEKISGEILSLDSIAVYRGMDIGTAKPTRAECQRVPHHLIDLADANEDFSVAMYLEAAHRVVDEVCARGNIPIFVGGTPMFLKGVLRGFDPGPPANWTFRNAVEKDVQQYGAAALHQRLQQVDPLAAHRIDPTDVRRMTRALEVAHTTGQPLSHRQVQFDHATPADQCLVFCLQWQRSSLHQRINQRVAKMLESGLLDEVQGLLEQYGELSRTASQAVGYREPIEYLQDQNGSVEQLRDEVAAHTRQLAKRQETWFRSFSEIRWVPVSDNTFAEAAASVHAQIMQSRQPPSH